MVLGGGTTIRGDFTINTNTGVLTARSASGQAPTASGVIDEGDYWRVWSAITNDTSGSVTLTIGVFPAVADSDTSAWEATSTGAKIVWGTQLETDGAFPTSYIATTTASAVRAADIATIPTVGWYNASFGTVFTQHTNPAAIPASSRNRIFSIYDNATADNRIMLHSVVTSSLFVDSENVNVADVRAGSAWVAHATMKHAAAWAAHDYEMVRDGGPSNTDTFGVLPINIATMGIGISSGGGLHLNGPIARITHWSIRRPSAELRSIST